MTNLAKIFIENNFKGIDDLINALKDWKSDKEKAIETIKELYDFITYQNKLLKSDKDTIKEQMEMIEKLQIKIANLNHRIYVLQLKK